MLKSKTAIITGSTSGIGTGIARALAQADCNVVIHGSREQGQVEDVRSGLETEYGITARYYRADMNKPDQIEKMILDAEKSFGSVDIIVNNAGIQHVAPVDEFPMEKWDAILSINLTAAFHMICIAAPLMKKSGRSGGAGCLFVQRTCREHHRGDIARRWWLDRTLEAISKNSFSPISVLGARFKSSKYRCIPPV